VISTSTKIKLALFFSGSPVKKACLFGSYVRNTEVKGFSDIDILVELDDSSKMGFGFVQMQFDLEKLL
jgi:predicted nucleotidyltransferase